MKHSKIVSIIALAVALLTSCEARKYDLEQVYLTNDQVDKILAEDAGSRLFSINDFLDTFMTERGDSCWTYRTRGQASGGIYLFSIDTIPSAGPGVYLRGRISTDDYGGNYYKTLIIQEITKDGEQQNLRLSVDIGSASGLYHMGQEILIRCNGLAVGRYANQPQLCVPSYNNNIYADKAAEKTGWAPGRIPSALFRKATHLIGTPDPSKLVYEELSFTEYHDKYMMNFEPVAARKLDGKLIKLKDVYFTGRCNDENVTEQPCRHYTPGKDVDILKSGVPQYDNMANVFAPTTQNVNNPQSRFITDFAMGSKSRTAVSASEYAKYASYYLPCEIDTTDYQTFTYSAYAGEIKGILSYYYDNGKYAADTAKWSINPRDLHDFEFYKVNPSTGEPVLDEKGNKIPWIPVEFSQKRVDDAYYKAHPELKK